MCEAGQTAPSRQDLSYRSEADEPALYRRAKAVKLPAPVLCSLRFNLFEAPGNLEFRAIYRRRRESAHLHGHLDERAGSVALLPLLGRAVLAAGFLLVFLFPPETTEASTQYASDGRLLGLLLLLLLGSLPRLAVRRLTFGMNAHLD